MSSNAVIFIIVFLAALALFAWNVFRRFRLVALGRPENRFDHLGKRLWSMVRYGFGERRVATRNYPFGFNHFVFHMAFLTIGIVSVEVVLSGLFPDYISISLLPSGVYHFLAFIFDLVWVVALACICVSILRRLAFRPSYVLPMEPDALITLGLFSLLFLGFFGLHASRIAQGAEEAARYMPVSNLVAAAFLSGASPASLAGYANAFWWLFTLTLLGFMNYIGVTKHTHVLAAIPNCFLRRLEKVNTQPREEFKKGNTFGVGRIDEFTWKGLFDSYACSECGRCSDVCPATFTGKPLNPRVSSAISR